jgi:NAD(P)-dependent dehydrogenase (short-subunit alcohol dehydrogenase family)
MIPTLTKEKTMKIIIMGASGNIGQEIVKALEPSHEIITAGLRRGGILVDYTDSSSVQQMFESAGPFDALVASVGGDSVFQSYQDLSDEDYEHGFQRKFLAQVNLVRIGAEYANDGGSFTLSSGYLSHYPNRHSIGTGPFNAAVDSFVLGVAPLLPKELRLNVVSPAPVVEPEKAGRGLVTAAQAAKGYIESVTGDFTGRVIRVWGGLENEPLPN